MVESFQGPPAALEIIVNQKKDRRRGKASKDNFRHEEMCKNGKKKRP